ncbi:MAG: HIT family protein [Actinomycetota bacterium]
MASTDCLFCRIARGQLDAFIVYEDEETLAFLDHRPVFPGHTLLVPRAHVDTLTDLPDDLVEPFFTGARTLARAVETAMEADGSFVAMNNVVSQSVPHLHVHIVPRKRKDGLRGFFWPRQRYGPGEQEAIADAIRRAVAG